MKASLLLMLWVSGVPRPSAPAVSAEPTQSVALPAQMTDAEVEHQISVYLNAIETPISTERWRALGPHGAQVLQQISSDPSHLPTRRSMALDGLVAIAPAT